MDPVAVPTEVSAVNGLVATYGELLLLPPDETAAGDGVPCIDVQSEVGHMACVTFLSRLESAADALQLVTAPRGFRSEFSVNYRALFPDGARHYRVDVLEASIDRHQVVWVNGDKFELNTETVSFAESLQQSLADLGLVLGQHQAGHRSRNASGDNVVEGLSRDKLATALTKIDVAWAAFENKYISNLIIIEDRARQLVVRAVDSERRLRHLEAHQARGRPVSDAECNEARRDLVECISRLNAVANHRRKGRDDLGGDILASALAALSHYSNEEPKKHKSAAEVLAADIVGAFDAIREYLREVKSCLERVDPHLCNNPGLASRLVDWEESWEVGGRYVRHTPLLEALCDLVSKIQTIQTLTPALATMCEECDVELFLVLPRIALLAFLAQPTGKQVELMRVMLPHRFIAGEACSEEPDFTADEDLEKLIQQFHHTVCVLAGAAGPQTTAAVGEYPGESAWISSPTAAARAVAWELLVCRAVNGYDGDSGALERFNPARRVEAQKVSESFSRGLERWSVELQRHCPEDWNQCSAVLVQCLTGTSKRHKFVKFQV